jgi:DNA-binding XRE family transcriptional regulator
MLRAMRPTLDAITALTLSARSVLGLTQETLGALVGSSRRTIQRWDARQAQPSELELSKLAIAVFPHDATLAQKLAHAADATLESLGLAAPARQPAPPPARMPHLVDTVVCAAAEALGVSPPGVRPVLLAAFRRAREVGLSVEDVEQAMSDALETSKARAPR